MIVGPSQCGKTTFTRQLLKYANVLFERPIHKIMYCYGRWQECFQDMVSQITFVEGIPEDIPALFPLSCCPGILVLDDLLRNCREDERILNLFIKVSHHCNVTCLYLTQNLSRSISLSVYYIIVFNNPRDPLGLRTLAQQAFERHVPYVWESFQDATSQPYGYLMFDLHPGTLVTLRLCSSILLESQSYSVAYVNKKTHKTDIPLTVDFS